MAVSVAARSGRQALSAGTLHRGEEGGKGLLAGHRFRLVGAQVVESAARRVRRSDPWLGGWDLVLPDLCPRDTIWLMNRLLERAIAELAALPEDQQEAVAARLLEEVERQTSSKGKWAKVADQLARLDLLQGKSQQFVERTREFRDSFSLRDLPNS
jgi:hypothetical protein